MHANHYILLTGATGLLGRSLVRDLTAGGRRLAVLVRGGKSATAAERVDEILADWRQVAGIDVECPVVLEGDIASPGLGLSPARQDWVARHVREVVHSAASLAFEARESDGEPYTSNVTGTRNVLDLCRRTGIRRLHHVSSAYVCGLREGRILEDELDVGQTPGNDYERSKIASEQEAVTAAHLDVCTVHRPSIIVGDLVHGFTNTFHGFYKPLRIVQPFVEAFVGADLPPGSLLEVLGMTGRERKNLVPVDWVSAVMTRIILDESLHGGTYHLTSDAPTSVGTLCRIYEELVFEWAATRSRDRGPGTPPRPPAIDPTTLGRLFLDQMHVYRAYWRDDPVFDARHTRAAVPDLAAPPLDDETIRRLCRFAIDHGFRWPPADAPRPRAAARSALEDALGPARWDDASGSRYGLVAMGPGGGHWTIGVVADTPTSLHVGLPSAEVPTVRLAAGTLEALLAGKTTAARAAAAGHLAVEAAGRLDTRISSWLDALAVKAGRASSFAAPPALAR